MINNLNRIYGGSIDEVYGTPYSIEDALEAIIPKIVKAALSHTDLASGQQRKQAGEIRYIVGRFFDVHLGQQNPSCHLIFEPYSQQAASSGKRF